MTARAVRAPAPEVQHPVVGRRGPESSKRLLLADLSAADVGARAEAAVRRGASRLGATVDAAPLRATAEDLARYAQDGRGLTPAAAHDALVRLIAALYSRARDSHGAELDVLAEEDDDPLGIALRGAWGRWRIAAGEAVDLPTLAVLAGIARQNVLAAVNADELKAHAEGRARLVPAGSARAWLEARGVAGFKKSRGS